MDLLTLTKIYCVDCGEVFSTGHVPVAGTFFMEAVANLCSFEEGQLVLVLTQPTVQVG